MGQTNVDEVEIDDEQPRKWKLEGADMEEVLALQKATIKKVKELDEAQSALKADLWDLIHEKIGVPHDECGSLQLVDEFSDAGVIFIQELDMKAKMKALLGEVAEAA